MRDTRKTNVGRRAVRTGAIAVAVAIAALAFSGDAEAHGSRKYAKHGKRYGTHGPVVVIPAPVAPAVVLRPVIVPRRILVRDSRFYDPYRTGRVWVPAHRHFHAVYRFPVATPHGVAWRSHAYCDGFGVGIVAGPVIRDERPHGYVSFGNENVRIGIGF